MIDLGKVKQNLYHIKLANGKILNIKKPTQGMLMRLIDLSHTEKNNTEVMYEFIDVLTKIFNSNVNRIKFSKKDIEEMFDIETAMIVLEDYLNFCFKDLGK